MNTSLHISSTARDALRLARVKRATPAVIAIALIAATIIGWHVIIGMALSSLH
jgi:hypothetical protein